MQVPFESLSEEASIIIFPGDRKFYPQELDQLENKLRDFCDSIETMKMSFKLEYNRFVIFFISEETVFELDHHNLLAEFIQGLEKSFNITLMDKVNVCFKQGEHVQRKEIPEFKKLIKNKGVSKKTIVFDHMITTKYEYENSWELPASESWVSHMF